MLTGELPIGRFEVPSKKVHVDLRLDEVVLRTLDSRPERRYQHASDLKTEIESICGISPVARQAIFGKEFRSKTTIAGIPLVHIAIGIDPATGKKRVAKGIIAIGDIAVGVLAFGGVAVGGIAFGGVAAGLTAFGGAAASIFLAIGGLCWAATRSEGLPSASSVSVAAPSDSTPSEERPWDCTRSVETRTIRRR